MEALKDTMAGITTLFQDRMSGFEAELHNAPAGSSTSRDCLVKEFLSFKKFILEMLDCLQKQIDLLALGLDNLEMRGRRKMVLLHGVTEQAKEDTAQVAAEVVRCHLKLADFTVGDIRRCHRMGRQAGTSKPRPILCKLRDVNLRDSIWFAKTRLKGTGITVSEFLTRTRHRLFMCAREKFGVNNCWSKQGLIYVLGSDGSRHRVNSMSDLENIMQVSDDVVSPIASAQSSSPSPSPAPKKARRAAARK
ncbi:hypothetical protein PYW07_005079 [Mythimna separata]|uniref:Uncharacterized protein n=1 Tax=Mythimna separata TaxID=271217 RepID=A0AAD8DPL3_MYTSE|nr:hypothetical protein PYW07_005079 [Mythimna separata]